MKKKARNFFQRRNLYGPMGRRWQGGWLLGCALVGGLIASASASPLFGLSLFIGLLWCSLSFVRRWQQHRNFQLRQDSVPFFWGVVALLRAGVAFPTAIREMASCLNNSFAARLRQRLEGYQRGVSLSRCLRRFQREELGGDVGILLALLEQCQRRGMPCLPLLESALPQWEERLSFETRVADIRRGVFAQGVMAAALPWLLWAFLYWGHFDFVTSVTFLQLQPALIGGAALQLMGFFVLARMACFHE